jgi:hypothetical protein
MVKQLNFVTKYLNISLDPVEMDRRLHARISRSELFGVAFCFSLIGIFVWLMQIRMGYPVDFQVYMESEATSGLYYSATIKPFFSLLSLLPFTTAYVVLCVINVLCTLYAVRVMGGNPLFALVGFQLLSILYYGNMSAIIIGGIALCWWGLAHQRWNAAGLGLLIALSKYHVGLFWCFPMIWYAAVSWRDFMRILVVPAVIGAISLVVYPLWPIKVLSGLSTFSLVHLGITLWIYIGAWGLLLWIPGLLLPMSRKERFFSILALAPLTLPYYQHIDLLAFAALPIGWLPWILQIAFVGNLGKNPAIRMTALLPGLILCATLIPAAYRAGKIWIEAVKARRIHPSG